MGNERSLCHNAVRDEVGRLTSDAGLPSYNEIEELHLLPELPSLARRRMRSRAPCRRSGTPSGYTVQHGVCSWSLKAEVVFLSEDNAFIQM